MQMLARMLLLAVAAAGMLMASEAKKPNFVVLFLDDHGCAPHPRATAAPTAGILRRIVRFV
jgi:hypothetical protein